MSYSYSQEREKIFSEEGQIMFLAIRDNALRLIEKAGCARLDKIVSGVGGDSFTMLACVDRLEEIGELKCVFKAAPSQHSIYTR